MGSDWFTALVLQCPEVEGLAAFGESLARRCAHSVGDRLTLGPSDADLADGLLSAATRTAQDRFALVEQVVAQVHRGGALFDERMPPIACLLAEYLGANGWRVAPTDTHGEAVDSDALVGGEAPGDELHEVLLGAPGALAVQFGPERTTWGLAARRKPHMAMMDRRQIGLYLSFSWPSTHILSAADRAMLKVVPTLLRTILVHRGWLHLPVHIRPVAEPNAEGFRRLIEPACAEALHEQEQVYLQGWTRAACVTLADVVGGSHVVIYRVQDDVTLEVHRNGPPSESAVRRYRALVWRATEVLEAFRTHTNYKHTADVFSLITEDPPERLIGTVARIIKRRTRSSAVRIYALEATVAGPQVLQIYRSDTNGPGKSRPFHPDLHLGAWALAHDRWLHYPGDGRHEQVDKLDEFYWKDRLFCEVEAQVERVWIHGIGNNPAKDPYEPLMIVPLPSGQRAESTARFAVGVWRTPHASGYLAAEVAALLRDEMLDVLHRALDDYQRSNWAKREAELYPLLQVALTAGRTPFQYRCEELRILATYYGACEAALWLQEPGGSGLWAPAGHWCAGHASASWLTLCDAVLTETPARDGFIQPGRHPVLVREEGVCWVFWLETKSSLLPYEPPYAQSLFRFVTAQRIQHDQEYTVSLVRRFEQLDLTDPDTVFASAVEKLETDGVYALLYTRGEHGDLRALRAGLSQAIIIKPGSLTEHVARQSHSEGVRLLDVRPGGSNSDALDQNALRSILDRLRIPRADVRSWLCYPVYADSGDAVVGLIKLISTRRYLMSSALTLVTDVARAAKLAFSRVRERLMLLDLNRMSSELAVLSSTEIRREMAPQVQQWFAKHFQENVQIYIVALGRLPMTGSDGWEPFFESGFGENDDGRLRLLRTHSSRAGDTEDPSVVNSGLLGIPFSTPSGGLLRGHLYASATHGAWREAGVQAVRELSVLLTAELNEHAWRRIIGRFRHALLAPVQGLKSAALLTCRLSGAPAELKQQIQDEVQAIQRWRSLERLYSGRALELRFGWADLGACLERAVRRAQPAAAQRDIRIKLDLKSVPRMWMDAEAIELALDNLMDNAVKYTFYHRGVRVSLEYTGGRATLRISNTGHRLPDIDIFREGERIPWPDPTRVIEGAGLGLPLVRAIILGHDGTISARDEALAPNPRDPARAPWQVTFTVDIPNKNERRGR
jgi:signal transduction histidine kinase